MMLQKKIRQQDGFTIVELMIATTVLSVILLLSTVMITRIGDLYYKGINQSRLQDDVRTISDQLTEQLQVNDGAVVTAPTQRFGSFTVSATCIGNIRYSYVTGTQIGTGSGQIDHVLWRDTFTTACKPVNLTLANPESGANAGANGTELIAPNSLLTLFSITTASPYTVTIGVAYGSTSLINLSGVNSTCKGGSGDAFCATASLSTTVVQRLT